MSWRDKQNVDSKFMVLYTEKVIVKLIIKCHRSIKSHQSLRGLYVAFFGAPSGRMFQRVKVPNPPDSGKDIAKSKGVLGNWESEGSWRQITGLTNRNHEG